MKVLFLGSGTFGLPTLAEIYSSSHHLLGVVTAPDKAQGRGRVMTPSPAKDWAQARGVRVLTPGKFNTPETLAELRGIGADVWVVVSYGALLSDEALAIPPHGCINVHPSLLPAYRGASPVVQALLDGVPETGMTIMAMAKDLDAGDILLQKKVRVDAETDARALNERLAALGGKMTLEALDLLEAERLERVPQDPSKATYCSKIKKERGRIDWAQPAKRIHDQVRAFVVWPGCFTARKGRQVKIIRSTVAESSEADAAARPGQVLDTRAPRGLIVKCGEGALAIGELQPEGGRPMSWKDFVNGSSIKPGEFFE